MLCRDHEDKQAVSSSDDAVEAPLIVELTTLNNAAQSMSADDNEKDVLVLRPGDAMMTREQIPPQHCCFYVAAYLSIIMLFLTAVAATHWTYTTKSKSTDWLHQQIYKNAFNICFAILFTWFTGAIFRDYLDIKASYTRKMVHITLITMPFIVDACVGEFDSSLALLWAFSQNLLTVALMSVPLRNCCNSHCCHYQSSRCKYLNLFEYSLSALERAEDRPNTLKWLTAQFLLIYLFLFPLNVWWQALDAPLILLVGQIVSGFGDGLAEPVGVRFGQDCQYKTRGCCTKYLYVRSVHGSAMVLLSGYVGVAAAYGEYSLAQFIIAMIVVPVVATMAEAKAPHTLDNPFITLFVGIAATIPLYINV